MSAVGVTAGVIGVMWGLAAPASAEAEVDRRTDCGWAPGDGETESIPGTGVTEFIPASACQLVFTPTGRVNYVVRGQLPEDAFVGEALVYPGLVVTPSGLINSHGSFGG